MCILHRIGHEIEPLVQPQAGLLARRVSRLFARVSYYGLLRAVRLDVRA